jgi:short-subunit dehydrogenase
MHLGGFLDEPEEVTRATFAVNVDGLINGMRAALPRMIERGGGRVVNVTSMAGKVPLPGAAVYAASKHAAVGLTEGVREELRGQPVEISQVLPTMVDTEFAAGVPSGRGLQPVSPEQVAAAIVGALDGPGRNVYVPGALRAVEVGMVALPKPVIGLIRRVVGDHRVLTDLDADARADYEERLAAQGRR